MFYKTFNLADDERGFLYIDDILVDILTTGKHRFYTFNKDVRIERYLISNVVFDHAKKRFMLANYSDLIAKHFQVIKLTGNQVGIIYHDGVFRGLLEPGDIYITWLGVEHVEVEILDLTEHFHVTDKHLTLLQSQKSSGGIRKFSNSIFFTEIAHGSVGLLFVDGKYSKMLAVGEYAFWKFNHSYSVKLIDLRVQTIDVSGQEILTRDRVSLRINLSSTYKVADPLAATNDLKDFHQFIYLELQLLLRESVGTKLLDELLENKTIINDDIFSAAATKLGHYGIQLLDVGVKDIILPGDMKAILNQVVEAQKEAEANLIKRKEETQAMRSLHNTAKVMENNPVLLRLKELEALERITTKIDKLTVYGGLDGVMSNLVRISHDS